MNDCHIILQYPRNLIMHIKKYIIMIEILKIIIIIIIIIIMQLKEMLVCKQCILEM